MLFRFHEQRLPNEGGIFILGIHQVQSKHRKHDVSGEWDFETRPISKKKCTKAKYGTPFWQNTAHKVENEHERTDWDEIFQTAPRD